MTKPKSMDEMWGEQNTPGADAPRFAAERQLTI